MITMLSAKHKGSYCPAMNKLDRKTSAQILHLLCEGQSIRAVTRLTGASKNTVSKLLVDAGRACGHLKIAYLQASSEGTKFGVSFGSSTTTWRGPRSSPPMQAMSGRGLGWMPTPS